ncbi:putative nuclease HARBI1, partial [Prorops nasuta]|uniref:putative nuclease HARBI1 n=1 Tax=Prorops nasuta TaxID=863751 RepID=UPI0034CD5C4B
MESFEENVRQWLYQENDILHEVLENDERLCQNNHRRPRVIRERINWFDVYDEVDFKKRFRLTMEQTSFVLRKIEHRLIHATEKNHGIPPIIQLLVTLRFIATGSFLIVVADFCGISESSAHGIIHKVILAIAELSAEFIKFPSEPEDVLRVKAENFNLGGFINVIGAIDGFHVRIRSFGGENSENYRNRKGFFSINVQAIVNSRMQIMDLVARWPGATHDSTIFDNSRIKSRFENGEFGNSILLGDTGYPCLPYLLTPLANPQTPAEVLYNESHIRTRSMIERSFGVLGKICPVLTIGSRFWTPQKTLPLIVTCAVLHNITRLCEEVESVSTEQYNNMNMVLDDNLHENQRLYLIDNYFEKLI